MDPRLDLVARLTAAYGDELDRRGPAAPVPWPNLPTAAALTAHLGGVHRWVTEILRTRERCRVPEEHVPPGRERAWFDEGRTRMLEVLAAVGPETPCWVIGGEGTAAFWRRRMVVENVKHLMDLRASATGWRAAPELEPGDWADGIDEFLDVFLRRCRASLAPLPGEVELRATDGDRSWRIGRDWTVDPEPTGDAASRISARTGDLALVLWERADPLGDARFRIEGDPAAVAALRDARVHPW